MEYHLIIDDVKTLGVENIARTASEGKQMLQENPVTHLYLDHDLGEQLSGYDVLCWAIENDLVPEYVQIVSHNPVGRQNMEHALESEGYNFVENYWTKLK